MLPEDLTPAPLGSAGRGAPPGATSGSERGVPSSREEGLALGDERETFSRLPGRAADDVRREATPSQMAGLSLVPSHGLCACRHPSSTDSFWGPSPAPEVPKGQSGGSAQPARIKEQREGWLRVCRVLLSFRVFLILESAGSSQGQHLHFWSPRGSPDAGDLSFGKQVDEG